MWWCSLAVIFVLQSLTIVSSTQVANSENVRAARQVTECCPCDHSARGSRSDQDHAADSSAAARAGVVEDCPCLDRSADAEGASSMLFPNAIRAIRPFLKSDVAKKDLKPLLHPEVDLASSMLSTLKEVTDEEYREALARDAARSAAQAMERDAQPEESRRNVVTIVLDPNSDLENEDFVAQASNNQETRCVHPLARSRYEPSNKSFKKTPILDSIWSPSESKPVVIKYVNVDNTEDATNIQEQRTPKNMDFRKVKSNQGNNCHDTTLARIRDNNVRSDLDNARSASSTVERLAENSNNDLGELIARPIKNLLKLRDIELIPKNVFAEKRLSKPQDLIQPLDLDDIKQKLSQFKLPNLIDKIKRREPLDLQDKKIKLFDVDDSELAASNVREEIIETNINKASGNIEPKTREPFKHYKPIFHIPDLRFLPSKSTEKVNNSNARFSTIPNLLEQIRNRKTEQIDNNESATNVEPQALTEKPQIISKLKAIKERSRKILPNILNKNVLDNSGKNSFNPVNNVLSTYLRNNENCQSDFRSELKNTPRDEVVPVETIIHDTIPSPSTVVDELSKNDFDNPEKPFKINTLEGETLSTESNGEDFTDKEESDNEINDVMRNVNDDGSINCDTTSDRDVETDTTIHIKDQSPDNTKIDNRRVTTNNEAYEIGDNSIERQNDLKAATYRRQEIIDENTDLEENQSEKESVMNNDESMKVDDNTGNEDREEDMSDLSTNEQSITMQDLQQMSDSLLEQSNPQKSVSSPFVPKLDQIKHNDEKNDNFQAEHLSKDRLKSKTLQTQRADVTSKEENLGAIDDMKLKSYEENSCIRESDEKGSENDNDTTAAASEPISNLVSSLRKNVVQPSSVGDTTNLFHSPSPKLKDILNLKSPKLEEIHSKMSNVLNPLSILSVQDKDQESECDNDLTPDPSEKRYRAAVPSKFSSEPVEVDVFQMNPFSSSRSKLPVSLPRLNLDTFKTNLAIPESLGLKPLLLESAVGDKRGVVGASLSFGSDKKDLMKASSSTLINKLRESNILGRPVVELPLLEELGNRMRERFDSFLTPQGLRQQLSGSNTIGDITDNFRSIAEKRVKNIQDTLRRAHETGSNILGNAYAKPNNIIEEISQRHEDLADKLKGIHHDLNDRLTSFHDEIVEKAHFPKLGLLNPKNDAEVFNFQSKKQNTQPVTSTRKVIKKPVRGKDVIPISRSNMERGKPFKSRMFPSASVPVPKTIEAPILQKSSNAALMQPWLREARPDIKNQGISSGNVQPTHLKSVSFKPNADIKAKSGNVDRPIQRSYDRNVIPQKDYKTHDPKPSKESSSLTARILKPTTNIAKQLSSLNSESKTKSPHRETLRRTPTITYTQVKPKPRTAEELRKAFALPKLSWPKATENSFLSKVREAMRDRLDVAKRKVISPFKNIGPNRGIDSKDMERSASTNIEKIKSISKPIKEKTSYKCEMICTRDSSETN